MNRIEVVPIKNTKREIRHFVMFSWKIYEDNPYWVPPLIAQEVDFIHKGTYHDSGIIQPFMAYRDGEPVGRIIAHYDTRYNERFNRKRGCIGFFECIHDKHISRALFDACQAWLIEQGMNEMYGPLNFTLYDASGLLIDDFENLPALNLAFNPPYYADLFADYGFKKVIDWYAYRFTRYQGFPPVLYKVRERVLRNKRGIRFRDANVKNFWEESHKMLKVFNKAWEENWGHMPLTEREFDFFAGQLKSVVRPELVIFAEKDGKLVGYILSTPDVNQAIKHANGRLFPFGLIKMLWEFRNINRIKTFMMGILPEFRGLGIETYFIIETYERAKKMGYLEADLSVIVETNTNMLRMLDKSGAQRYKTFRHYTKPITA